MKNKNTTNLKPWKPGESGNPSGRKVGSKNMATIVRQLLEEEIDPRFPLDDNLKQLIADNGTTYAKAIVYALMIKATQGDVRAANSLIELQMAGSTQEDDVGLFQATKLQVEIVGSKQSAEHLH